MTWVNLEIVLEFISTPHSKSTEQAVSYAGFLLLASHISSTGFVPILVDASGVYRTGIFPWRADEARLLLLTVLDYISSPPPPMIDETIKRKQDGTFEITVGYNIHKGVNKIGVKSSSAVGL